MSLSLTAIYPETKSEGLSSGDMCFQLTHNTSTSEAVARQLGWGRPLPLQRLWKLEGKNFELEEKKNSKGEVEQRVSMWWEWVSADPEKPDLPGWNSRPGGPSRSPTEESEAGTGSNVQFWCYTFPF